MEENAVVFTEEDHHLLGLLAKKYPTVQEASAEIINLQAILNLPKGTEHFISDIHGEYEAFLHMMNCCSGVVKSKIDEIFQNSLTRSTRDKLATLIYYPAEKLEFIARSQPDMEEWYRINMHRLLDICRHVASKYTRSKVREAMPKDYAYIIDELLQTNFGEPDKQDYYENIINTIISVDQAPAFMEAISSVIKRLAVDRLHVVGDIFDRGPRADIIMDYLCNYHSVDFQWGNHDILWMGAASGSRTLVATVIANSIHYNNIEVIETGYGISLRPLSIFANDFYSDCDLHQFSVKLTEDTRNVSDRDKVLSARMYKAITVILFKLEGQKILRHPEYNMNDRLMLDKIDYEHQSITIDGKTYHLEDCDFPTVDPADPYKLTPEEEDVINQLTHSFRHSEKLKRHVDFLYSKGALYTVHNGNLLFHGCIPMNDDGSYVTFELGGKKRSGKEFLDWADQATRRAYYRPIGAPDRQVGMDFLWFLWAGRNSPIFGRDRMATFERRLIADKSAWVEKKNAYYTFYEDPAVCERILNEFGLYGPHCHIINGHVPVKAGKGESPLKGGGKLIVIDGGFCKAYQPTSGIAGYTLIYTSRYYSIVSHQPFSSKRAAVEQDADVVHEFNVFESFEKRLKISDTDDGEELRARVGDLKKLLQAYRTGFLKENHGN